MLGEVDGVMMEEPRRHVTEDAGQLVELHMIVRDELLRV